MDLLQSNDLTLSGNTSHSAKTPLLLCPGCKTARSEVPPLLAWCTENLTHQIFNTFTNIIELIKRYALANAPDCEKEYPFHMFHFWNACVQHQSSFPSSINGGPNAVKSWCVSIQNEDSLIYTCNANVFTLAHSSITIVTKIAWARKAALSVFTLSIWWAVVKLTLIDIC